MKSCRVVWFAALLAAAGSVFCFVPGASAQQTYQWDPLGTLTGSDSSGTWDTVSSIWAYSEADNTWTDGSIAQFGYGTAGSYTVDLVANVNPLGIILGSNGLDSYSITGSNTLTIGASGLAVNTSGTISAPVALGAAQAWTTATGQTLTIGGAVANSGNLLTFAGAGNDTISSVISGSGGLTVSGPGLVALNNYNTYTGATTVNGGTLEFNNGGATGTVVGGNNIYVNNGGTLFLNHGDALASGANASNLNVTSGGLVVVNSGTRVTLWNPVNMTGGTLAAAGPGQTDGTIYFPTNYSLCGPLNATSDAAGNPATISATIGLQNMFTTGGNNGNVVLNVTRGPGAVDLNVTGQIGSWSNPTSLTITGGGVTQLASANVYLGGTTISGSSTVITGAAGLSVGTVNLAAGSSLSIVASAAPAGLASQYYNLAPVYGGVYQTIQGNNALLDAQMPYLTAWTISGANGAAGSDQRTSFDYGGSQNGATPTFPSPYGTTVRAYSNFYARWTGEIDIPQNGTYTFYTQSDDGSLLGIDGNTVVMNNYSQGITQRSGAIYLTAGMHALTAIYDQGGGDYSMNASISGPGLSGTANIPASMLQTGALYLGGLQGGGQIDMAGNGISVGWNDANTTFSGNIIDSTGSTTATLLKAGQGGLMLTGVNTYAGLTTVAGGTLAAANPSSLPGYGTSSISVAGGATLAVQSGDGTTGFSSSQIDSILANTNWASAYTSSSNVPFLGIDTTNGDFTYGTNITQNIGLSKFGPHTLYLTGANTYPGGTTINAGVLNINGDTALGAASGAIAFTGNSTLQAGNEGIVVNSARTVTINSGVTGTIDTASYNNFTIAAPIGGTGNLAKIGAGTLTLSASSVNSYSGKTYLQGGAIAVNTSLQGLYEGVVSVQNSAWDTTDPIPQTSIQPVARWGASTQTSANAATAVYPSWPNNTTIGYTGYIDNTSNQPLVYTFGKNFDDNASVVVDGTTIISNTTWNQNVTGQITLAPGLHTVSLRFGQGTGGAGPNTGAYDNYGISYNTAGNTNTGGNWYQMGATDPSGDTQFYAAVAGMPNSQVVMSSNTTLDLSAAGVGVAGVGSLADAAGSPTGALVLLGSNTLVTGLDNTNTSFSGTISGNGSLVKQGTGMFILAGSNTYTGTTSVVAGILDATSTAALPGYASAGTVGVMGGATLAVQANVNGTSGWNSSQIDTLWGNASWASSTAALGIDTTQGDFTYGTNITEAFGLTKLGANALILTGANTYPGPTTVSAGTLQIGNGGSGESLNGTSGVGLAANTTLAFNLADTLTIAAPISGAGSLFQTGSGTTILTGSNTYTGATTVNSGTLQIGNGGSGASIASTSGVAINSGAVLTFNHNDATSLAGAVSGAGSLFHTGGGTLTVSNINNTYAGGTTVNSGMLMAGGNALGSGRVTVSPNATLAVGGTMGLAGLYYSVTSNNFGEGNGTPTGLGSLATVQANFGAATPTLVSSPTSLNFNTNGSGFPAPYNTGQPVFSGYYSGMIDIATPGTYTFNTSSDDGSVVWIDGNAVVLNNYPQGVTTRSGSVTLAAGYHDIVVAYNNTGGGYGMVAQISGANNTTMVNLNTADAAITPDLIVPSLAGAGSVDMQAGNLIVGTDNTNSTFGGNIFSSVPAAAAVAGVTKFGTGCLTVTGSLNYGGATNVGGGTLQIGDGTAGHDASITTSVLNDNAAVVYNVGGVQNPTYPIAGGGSLAKAGPGTLVLSQANTYSGATYVNGGVLSLAGAGALGSTSAVTFGGGTLQYTANNTTDYSATIKNSTGPVSIDTNGLAISFGAALAASNSGGLFKTGAGTLTLASVNQAYQGATTVNAGTLVVGGGALGTGPLTINSGATLQAVAGSGNNGLAGLYYNLGASPVQANFNSLAALQAHIGAIGAPNVAAVAPVLNLNNGGANFPAGVGPNNFEGYYSGMLDISSTGGGTYTFQTGSDDGSMLWVDGQMVVNDNAFQGFGYPQKSGTISLAPGLHNIVVGYFQGTGGYVLEAGISGPDTSGGTIDLGAAGSPAITPDLVVSSLSGGGNVNLQTGNLITGYDNSNTTFGGSVTSSGLAAGFAGLTKIGSGALTVTGSLVYGGPTTISGGTLLLGDGTVGHDPTVSTSSLTLNNGSPLIYNVAAAQMAAYPISGGSSLTKLGPGTLTLAGSNTYTGVTTIANGTVALANSAALGGGGAVTFAGGTLQYSSSNTADYSFLIKNSTSPVNIDTNGQAVTYVGAIDASNTAGLYKTGAGTLTMNANSSYSGPTTIANGTLQLGNLGITGNVGLSVGGAGSGNYSVSGNTLSITGQGGDFWGGTQQGEFVYRSVPTNQSFDVAVHIAGMSGGDGSWAKAGIMARSDASDNNVNTVLNAETTGSQVSFQWTNYNNNGANFGGQGTSVGPNWLRLVYNAVTDVFTGYESNSSSATAPLASDPSWVAEGTFTVPMANSTFLLGIADTSHNAQTDTAIFDNLGTLFNGGNPLPAGTPVSIAANGTLDLNGVNQQIVSLSDYTLGNGGSIVNSNQVMPATLTLAPTASTTFSGSINDNGSANSISLLVNGTGTQVLAGTSNFSGTTTVTSGTLAFASIANADGATPSSLGMPSASSGTITLGNPAAKTNGYLQFIGSASCSSNRTIVMSNDGYIDASGANGAVLTLTGTTGSPAIYSVGGSGITLTGTGTGVVSGAVNDDGGGGIVNKNGTGTWVLSSPNSYSGATNVNAGVLAAGVAGALPTTTDVYISGGTLDATAAAQTVNSLTMTTSAALSGTLNLAIGNLFTASTTASLTGGTLDVFGSSSTSEELMAFPNGYTGTFANAIIPSGFTLSYQANQLDLLLASVGPPTWQVGSGNWSVGSNWTGGTAPNGAQSTAVVNAPVGSGTVAITLDVPVTLGTLQLGNSTGTGGYTISGNATDNLTFDNGTGTAVLSASDGTHTLATPITLNSSLSVSPSAGALIAISGNIGQGPGVTASLTLANSGELVLSGSDSYQGGTIVDNGKLVFTSSAAVPASGALIVGAGGIVAFDPSVTAGAVELASSQQVVTAAPMATAEIAATAHAAGGAVEAVPEPGTLALLLAALGGALVWAPGMVRSRVARRGNRGA